METKIEALLERNLQEVFNGDDAAKRREVIAEIWAEDCVFIGPDGIHRGRKEIEEAVSDLWARFPGYRFAGGGPVQAQHGVGRVAWTYGPADDPRRITGEDIGVIENGKLVTMYTFIDPPRSAGS